MPTNPGTANLVSWWAHDTGALTTDSHGSNTLTNNNTVTEGTAKVGTAAGQYTAANLEYLSIDDGAQTGLDAAGTSFSICAWVKADSLPNAGPRIVSKDEGAASGYALLQLSSGEGFQFYVRKAGADVIVTTSSGYAPGSWYFVVARCVADTSIDISVNGGSVDTTALAGTYPVDGASEFRIGGLSASSTRHWNGLIDEVAFFNKALSADEIDWLYNSGAGRAYSELGNPGTDNLVSWWAMDSGALTVDSHGSNTLTDVNTVGTGTGLVGTGSADFESANSEALTSTDASLDVLGMASWCAWINGETLPHLGTIINKEGAGTGVIIRLVGSGQPEAYVGIGGAWKGPCLWGSVLSTSTWYFVAVTHNPTDGKLKISVNAGTQVEYSTGGGNITTNASAFGIGGRGVGDRFFDGLIDEVAVFTKELSADEISWLYNSGAGRAYSELLVNPGTDNLVAWWAMDETSGTRADSHGSYDLTDNNTVLSAAGKQSNAADFERDNSESLSLSTNIVVADGNPWTLAGWLKFETVTNATFASHDYTPGNYWRFYRTGTTVVLYSDDNSQSLSWSWSPSAATWYHLALSCDGAGNLTLRVDGTSLGAGAMSKSGLVLARFATLPLAGWYFDGLYDEWAVFDDELTQDEIDWLVNSGAGRAYSELLVSPSTDNLVSWWALDEASGTRADSHGANDLTDNNTVLSAAGKQSNAADFEFGNNEYLSIADNAALSVGDVDWTILGWGQIESFTDVVIQTLASKYIGFDREFRFSVFKVGAGNWQAQLNVRNTANTAEQNNNATDFGALSTGTWYLFSARHDSVANTITVGVNTTHTATAWSGGIRDSAQPFMLGGDGDAGRTWDGLLDEWAVFKSAAGGGGALSDDEIAWLYNSGAGRAYSELLVNPTTANLVSWWAMESGALTVDSHGSNTLTDNNTVGEGAAKVGTASAQYTGTNNEYHSLASIALAAGTDWTVAGWIKADSWTGGAGAMLGHTASSPNATRFHIWSNGGEIIYTTPLAISWRVNHTFNLGQWYHCAVVATSNTSMKIYVDGVAIYTVGASTYGFEFTEIGRLLASNTYSLDGALDEWAIFDGHALSAAEIAWLYNSGAGRAYSELLVNPTTANLVSWWALDETSGTRADSHGTNHLTDNNTVLSAAGKQSNAADFELSNSEYLSAANHASLQLSASWSMCGWLQHESAPSGSGMHWVGKYQGGTNYYTLSTALATGKISWGVGASAIDSPITPTLGQWYFVAVWIESGVSYIQVNNGTISSVAAPDPLPLPNASLNLGSLAGVAGLVDGLMDEWAIWQNRTLTAGERAWLYNSGAGRAYSELAGVGGVIFGGIGGTLVRGIGTRGLVRA